MVGPERFVNWACVICMDTSNSLTSLREGAIVARLQKRGRIKVQNRIPIIPLRFFDGHDKLATLIGIINARDHAFTIQPECTKKSKSFTHFEESICSLASMI